MQSKIFSIVVAVTFLAGVAAWYGARYWTFDRFQASYVIAFVLAIALSVSALRGDAFSRWLTFALSAGGAYASFHLYFYMNSRDILLNSREITGEAFMLPGVLFALCAVLQLASLMAKRFTKWRTFD